jgi:hypothetical protein
MNKLLSAANYSDAFISSSKVVIGKTGSGKTTYLKYEAARFVSSSPNGLLIIGDIHFDPKNPWWEAPLGECVINEKDKIVHTFCWLHEELQLRMDKGDRFKPGQDLVERDDRSLRRVKFICDEFTSLLGCCNREEVRRIQDCLLFQQAVGRSYGMDITLSLTNNRLGRFGFDSSVLSEMQVLDFDKEARLA